MISIRNIFLLIFMQNLAFGQIENSNKSADIISTDSSKSESAFPYFPTLLHNFIYQAGAVTRISKKDEPWIGCFLISTCLLISQDNAIDRQFRQLKSKNDIIGKTSPVVTDFGGKYGFYIVGLTGITGLATKDHKMIHTTLLASQALITSGLWSRMLKMAFSRPRPSFMYDNPNYTMKWSHPFKGFYKENENRSASGFDAFPSGHTATAFSIATVFAMEYRNTSFIPVLAYTSAGLIGLSRMTEHTHWASDILAGGCLGYLCAKQIVRNDRKNNSDYVFENHKKKPTLSYTIFPTGNSINGLLSLNW